MSNAVYQRAVEELEAIISPRVVSRSLQEGLRQVGRSPDTVDYDAIEQILKAQVYRQLQVTMPVTQAKQTIADILGRIEGLQATDPAVGAGGGGVERQGERLEALRNALRPFNLYFEWPEVQKLRAQIQLLEAELEEGREAASLAEDAEAQLRAVEQKLEDQLVIQARELGELEEALEQVRTLGGAKVRRLENLVNQIRASQEGRQLAPAEVERSRRLARDLRKLMESSVYAEDVAAPRAAEAAPGDGGVLDVETEEEDILTIDTAGLDPEVTARLLLLDLEGERHDLEALASEFAGLFAYMPNLAQRVHELRVALDGEASVADELEALRHTLAEAFASQRETLREELEGIDASLGALRDEADTAELRQALRVALGILSTTLPSQPDIVHVRHLHQLALEQAEEFDRAEEETQAQVEAQLRDQAEILGRLESTLLRYEGRTAAESEYQRLQQEVDALREAHSRQTLAPETMAAVRQAEEKLESAMAVLADERIDRQRAHLRNLLSQIESLPALDTVAARIGSVVAELTRQLKQLESRTLDDAQVDATGALVDALKADARASAQRKLEALAEQAGELGSTHLLERIRAAADGLEEERFPDLAALKSALKQEREAQRSDQVGELHRLEREAVRFAGSDTATYAALQQRLAESRERIERGALAPGLAHGWVLLQKVESEVDTRLRGLEGRLDEALASFHAVEKLNSDDVASVRRILTHLDGQRGAFERVSVGLRLQLEASLREAEALLVKLREEYEATRAIADQLVSGGVLDDVLGLFADDAPGTDGGASARAPAATDVLKPYLAEDDVSGAALLGPAGELLAGALPLPAEALRELLGALGHAHAAAAAAGGTSPALLTLEFDGGLVVLGWAGPDRRVLLTLTGPADLVLLMNRLRRDLPTLADARTDDAHPSEPSAAPTDARDAALGTPANEAPGDERGPHDERGPDDDAPPDGGDAAAHGGPAHS